MTNKAREIPAYALIWVVALVARALFLWQIRDAPVFTLLMGDAVSYDAWAQQIAKGDWLGSGVFYQAPLYPYFLGMLYNLFGKSLLAVRLVQIIIGATSCVLLAWAGRGFFKSTVGLLAGVFLALYPTAIFFDCSIQKSVLDLFGMCVLLATLGWRRWTAAGVALGLLALTRENALIFVPIVVAYLFISWRGELWTKRLQWVALFLGGLTVVLLPVAFRNLAVGSEFHLTTAQFGPNFYIGNGKDATGFYQPLRWGHGSAKFERDDASLLAEQAMGHKLSPADVSQYWKDKALTEIRESPARWRRLMAKKWALVWNVSELGDSEDQYTYGDWSMLLWLLNHLLHFGILCPLAALGVCLTWKQRGRLWLLYAMALGYAASVTFFYVFSRYRLPIVPLLVLFMAAGLAYLRAAVREKQWKEIGAGVAAAVVAAMFCNRTMAHETEIRATTRYNIAVNLVVQQAAAEQAIVQYLEAVRLKPDFAVAHHGLGVLLARKGKTAEAIDEYLQALRFRPDYPEAHNNLGAALAREGKLTEAITNITEALHLDPNYADAHYNLAILLANQGKIEEATSHLRIAARLSPGSETIRRAIEELRQMRSQSEVPPTKSNR